MTEPIDPPEGEVEGPTEPVPGGQPSTPPQPVVPAPGTYGSRNAGRRASLLQGLSAVITDAKLQAEIGGIRDEINNVGEVVEDYGPQITDLIENRVLPWAVPTISPLSQTINRRADASFQLSDLMTPVLSGTTDAAGHNHTHTISLESSRMFRSGAVKGTAYFAFITPAITREYEQLNFMLGAGTTTPASLDIAVYVVDPDTRAMTRQVHAQNVAAGLPLAEAVVTVPFDKWVAVQGSYIAVAFLWHGTGDTRHILGIGEAQRPLPTEIIFPAKISAVHADASLAALPAAVDGTTQVNFNTWYAPYAELSEKIGEVLRSFTESWPNVGDAPRPWVHLTSSRLQSSGGYVRRGSGGNHAAIYDTPLSSDYVRVRTSIHHTDLSGASRRSTVIVRGTNNLGSGIGLSANRNNNYEVITWSGLGVDSAPDWTDRTVVATIARVPAIGDQLEVDYIDGLLTVRINGVVQVTDMPIPGHSGPAHRFVGLHTYGSDLLGEGPRFGPWTARDLPQSGGDEDGEGVG